ANPAAADRRERRRRTPVSDPATTTIWETRGGIRVACAVEPVDGRAAIDALTSALDARRGALFASSYEYPGRYTRWDMGFVDPPLAIEARGREARVRALTARGRVLLPVVARALEALPAVAACELGA